ncbi:UNVERIFIED_CONTAM: hypothetical protein NCL1_50796 [Trichonephila clavipes]
MDSQTDIPTELLLCGTDLQNFFSEKEIMDLLLICGELAVSWQRCGQEVLLCR